MLDEASIGLFGDALTPDQVHVYIKNLRKCGPSLHFCKEWFSSHSLTPRFIFPSVSSTFALVVLLLIVHATAAPAHCNGYACMRCCVMIGRERRRGVVVVRWMVMRLTRPYRHTN